jgi:hypothetical protein
MLKQPADGPSLFQYGLRVCASPMGCSSLLIVILPIVTTFPYFPAIVIDAENDQTIPQSLRHDRAYLAAQNKAVEGEETWLVRFFDHKGSYGWIPKSRIDPFLADKGMYPRLHLHPIELIYDRQRRYRPDVPFRTLFLLVSLR